MTAAPPVQAPARTLVVARPQKRDLFLVDEASYPRRQLQAAAALWLEEWAIWRIYATLTFKEHVAPASATRSLKRWFRAIAQKKVRAHFKVAVGMETTREGVSHFHVLLALPDEPPVLAKTLTRLWRWEAFKGGFTDIEDYKRGGGAAAYIAKGQNWVPEVICHRPPACRHRRGCLDARGPWLFDHST